MSRSRSNTKQSNSRIAALKTVTAVLDNGASLAEFDPGKLEPRDAAYASHLAYGVLRWLSALHWLAGKLVQKPLKNKDRDIQRLIMLGIFQLWKDETAEHAAIHETAECARLQRKAWAVGLVNAVLRRFQREQQSLLQELSTRDEQYAHPAWMLDQIRLDWPDEESTGWQQIAGANNLAAPLWLRCSAVKKRAEILTALADSFKTTPHPLVETALSLSPPAAVGQIPGFAEGHLSVQDPAAQLAASLLDVQPGQRVLDACCAPGGKSGHLLELHPGLDLLALDRSEQRLQRVQENMDRLRPDASGLDLRCADAGQTEQWWDKRPFQRILLDAPCSATGVIRRHPEIKWLRSAQQIDEVSRIQKRLLEQLWPTLDKGGMLLYATCSIFRQENDRQIEAFIRNHPDAERVNFNPGVGKDTGWGWQIMPGEQDMDGFFYALLRKTV